MNKTFILVDDDPDDRELFILALQMVAPTVHCHCFKNGRDALLHLKTTQQADLVFLDLNMPLMNGWECLRLLKQEPLIQHIPVIIYSTSSSEKEIQLAREEGAKCFCIKPDDFTTLSNILLLITQQVQANSFGAITRAGTQRHLECFY
jgi:CheY-like chemotaxis protein